MLGVFRVEEFVTIESMHVGEGFAADLALEGPRGSNKTFIIKDGQNAIVEQKFMVSENFRF